MQICTSQITRAEHDRFAGLVLQDKLAELAPHKSIGEFASHDLIAGLALQKTLLSFRCGNELQHF
jgi:hypothetical protein